jgi:hypothetical protein
MRSFDNFIEEAATKRCPTGKYYCFTDKKCKKMPSGYHVGRGGYLEKNNDSEDSNGPKNGNSNGDNGSNGNGDSGNGGGGE